MPASWPDSSFGPPRQTKVILVVDVVESVRLMEQNEHGFIQRWQQFVRETRERVLPAYEGHMHKSLGDGLMLEFALPHQAVQAAIALQQLSLTVNEGVPSEEQMLVRIGAHLATFVADEHDIYGSDVNLTARIASLAGPGEIVVTSQMRDRLTASLDADIEDLGACHLKHVREPVHAYRVGRAGSAPVVSDSEAVSQDFRPTLAIIPFEVRSNEPEHFVIGELIADGLIAQLAKSPDLRVISRLSTTGFRGRGSTAAQVQKHLGASFVLSGSYVASGPKLLIMAELTDARSGRIVWADRMAALTADLLEPQSELLHQLGSATSRALLDAEVERSLTLPMPRLDSSALLLGGISMMHRSSPREFERSREALDALVERHGRIATPRAWLAKWHILRIVRGMSDDPRKEARLALDLTRRALDSEPEHALTLAIEGLVYSQVLEDFAVADQRLSDAVRSSPNESMAWLFRSVLSSMWGSTDNSVNEALFASALSPVDPLKYFFNLITAAALLSNNQHARAIEHAQSSIRANRHHAPTYRVLITALVELGELERARSYLPELLREQPGLTVSAYLSIGSASSVTRQRCAEALRALGVPEH